jgi:flagellar basal-body rod modification protein FlgD
MSTTQIADAITAASSISSSSTSKTTTSNLTVDSETFLTLLAAQMQYQDPLNPQTDTEFVTQLAQMSSLEEMQEIGAGMSSIQAYSLVGQYAYAEVSDSDTGETNYYYGTIDSIVNESGTYYAVIGIDAVNVDNIVQLFDPGLLDTDTALVDSSNLIVKTVKGCWETEYGKT